MGLEFIFKEKLNAWCHANEYFEETEDGLSINFHKIANHLPQILPMLTSINLRDIYLYLCQILADNEFITMTEFDFTATVFDSLDNSLQEYLTSPICFSTILSNELEVGEQGRTEIPIEEMGTYLFLHEKNDEPEEIRKINYN